METISVKQFAEKYDLNERTARNYCAVGKIPGAYLTGKTWNIPADAEPPAKTRQHLSPLLDILRQEKAAQRKGGIYHRTQIDLTYNSNHIEGSRLTHEQTRYIYDTNTIGLSQGATSVDDIIETVNHFRCIDYVIDHAMVPISEHHLQTLHKLLKNGTSDSRKEWFAVGNYKRLPNEVGGQETTPPEEVKNAVKDLVRHYNSIEHPTLDDLLDFHVAFERIHPFQDGNGRVGRLVLFWQCLQAHIVPFILTDDLRMFYYRGLQNWGQTNGYLRDTCLTAQDRYKELLDYFHIRYLG